MERENVIYIDSYPKTHFIRDVLMDFEQLLSSQNRVSIAGRVMAKRGMGKVIFFDVQDGSGRMQCFASGKEMGESLFDVVKKGMQIGDIIGAAGSIFETRSEEKTVNVSQFTVLTKCERGLPEKFHGLVDVETRYRQRYLDLIMNQGVRDVFMLRSKLIQSIRAYLSENGFFEVETPILQKNPCGAAARPFLTHHNAFGRDFYLRISPETYLKQLIVGGMERIFEIGKNFRNEGIDRSHLQEFTMLEYYAAYWNYTDNVSFIQKLLRHVISETTGGLKVELQGDTFDFESDFLTVDFRSMVESDSGIDVLSYDDVAVLGRDIRKKSIDLGDIDLSVISLGNLIDLLYKKVSRPKLVQPTIVMNYPSVLLPLARPKDIDKRMSDSFQIVINGWEVVKAYSELTDPILQRRFLEKQSKSREEGDEEAMFLDDDFLISLEYGMPPVSGLGLGIDRLIAILTNQVGLREVVLFPLMR